VVLSAFAYAVVRVVPDLQRGEFVNAGVVLFARQHGFLAARTQLDVARLAAIAPDFDVAAAEAALAAFVAVAAGDPAAGAMAALDQSERFGWLVAPSSTMVQCSPVHTGICVDPQAKLDELFEELVATD
jgi:hypothetical protein